jgi:hypothetical protein
MGYTVEENRGYKGEGAEGGARMGYTVEQNRGGGTRGREQRGKGVGQGRAHTCHRAHECVCVGGGGGCMCTTVHNTRGKSRGEA